MSQPSDLAQGDTPAYTKTMMDYLGDREPFSVFEATPSALRAAAEAVSEDKLRTPEAPGKWSVLNVVQHLAHVELVLGTRFRIVLAEEGSPLAAMDPDRWIANLFPDEFGLEEALTDFANVRAMNLRLLRRVRGDQWARYGIHSQRGNETLSTMVRMYAAHDLYHLYQIERIRRAVDS
ncbi:MAG: DinB family protein [Candidatus Hydrogenedentes bacterium]|nr:DinB family protein [Candidatus Hydrogenedentota bacterium]